MCRAGTAPRRSALSCQARACGPPGAGCPHRRTWTGARRWRLPPRRRSRRSCLRAAPAWPPERQSPVSVLKQAATFAARPEQLEAARGAGDGAPCNERQAVQHLCVCVFHSPGRPALLTMHDLRFSIPGVFAHAAGWTRRVLGPLSAPHAGRGPPPSPSPPPFCSRLSSFSDPFLQAFQSLSESLHQHCTTAPASSLCCSPRIAILTSCCCWLLHTHTSRAARALRCNAVCSAAQLAGCCSWRDVESCMTRPSVVHGGPPIVQPAPACGISPNMM